MRILKRLSEGCEVRSMNWRILLTIKSRFWIIYNSVISLVSFFVLRGKKCPGALQELEGSGSLN